LSHPLQDGFFYFQQQAKGEIVKDLVRVSEIEGRTPFAKTTFYKWRHQGRHPEIFVSLGKRNLFVDLVKLERVMNEKSERASHA
jgi:hypothetical protein